LDCREVLTQIGRAGLTSVLVEGGAGIHASLLRAGLVDEVFLFIAPLFIGSQGAPLVAGDFLHPLPHFPRLRSVDIRQLGDDALLHGLFNA
jgi:diaminohydroxyphosphoribosylaminopyrimidine deaminase/5-amino-6-(5-phosphoribosylamino)uracil reductase